MTEGMGSLLDKSLVQQVEQTDGQARFTILETIREYGLDRLAASGENQVTQRAYAAYCLVLAEEGNLPLTPSERTDWLALCDAEHHNLRAALDWLIAHDSAEWALRLGLALYWFWEPREHLVEGRERLEAILKMRGCPGAKQEVGVRSGTCRGPGKYSRRLRDISPAASRGVGHLPRAGRAKRDRETAGLRGPNKTLSRRLPGCAVLARGVPAGLPGTGRRARNCRRPQKPGWCRECSGRSYAGAFAARRGCVDSSRTWGLDWRGLVCQPPGRRGSRSGRPCGSPPSIRKAPTLSAGWESHGGWPDPPQI